MFSSEHVESYNILLVWEDVEELHMNWRMQMPLSVGAHEETKQFVSVDTQSSALAPQIVCQWRDEGQVKLCD